MRCRALAVLALFATACTGAAVRSGSAPELAAADWESLLAAEDARLATPAQVERVRQALRSENETARAMAVRALGRSERSEFAPAIVGLLRDGSATVRAAAAHALGHVTRDTVSGIARRALLDVLPQPGASDAAAAAIAETLGRLHADAAASRDVAQRLALFLAHDNDARTGALRGLYFLARQPAARASVADAAARSLRSVLESRSARAAAARERGLAVATLALASAAEEATLIGALGDPEPQVRREAVAAAATLRDTAAVRRTANTAAGDPYPAVRYDVVRIHAARLAAAGGCLAVAAAARDTSTHVSLLAIDLLGTTCRSADYAALLDSIAAAPAGRGTLWHEAAHAAVSLAGIDVQRAHSHVHALARHPSAFARAYAARAAGAATDTALLHVLARDSSPNVRTAAVAALAEVAGHAADAVYAAQLASDESELLITAAAALEGNRDPAVAVNLLDALDRVTALQRETSRDARLALLARVEEMGGAPLASRLTPYLRDFDAAVAARAADVLEAWTGTRPGTAPRPLFRQPLPSFDDVLRLAGSRFVFEMENGGEIEVRLLPFDAPTNAARFARLARSGRFDGLTFHRVVPNFVVQGGSPGANEYSGAGPFTRDEVGVPNWRGTVGLSTRGRDTGDAQFYINLIDNVRLDHQYTVFGVVTRGMDVVDRLQEGAVIRHVREERPQD